MSVQKQISPSSPSRSASACMSVAEKIYDMYGHSSFSAAEAASAAGLSATSGTFKGLFSDLKQYDLIEKTRNSGSEGLHLSAQRELRADPCAAL